MHNKYWLSNLVLACIAGISHGAHATERVVVLTSDVAEIVVALGHAGDVVGRDSMAKAPELAQAQNVGLSHALAVDVVAQLKPTLVVGSHLAKPDTIWQKLNELGIHAVEIGGREDGADYADVIRSVGTLLGDQKQALELAQRWQHAMQPPQASSMSGKRVLISYDGKTVAGRNTPCDVLIRAAGGINAAADIDGYKPLSAEAMADLKADVILLAQHNHAIYGSADEFRKRPEIEAMPAGKQGHVYEVPVHDFFTINLHSPEAVAKLRMMDGT
jgi:iron complex transport system substrate-binding protein